MGGCGDASTVDERTSSTQSNQLQDHHARLQRAALFCRAVYGVDVGWWQAAAQDLTRVCAARHSAGRARLTLTFAQSHDGKIAGPGKRMLALSSADSMIMTHTLRVLHDAILVGVGTLLNDDPQLNARLLNPLLDGSFVPMTLLPRPVVLDGRLRTPLACKLLLNARQGKGLRPLIVTAENADAEKVMRLRQAGADVAKVICDADGRLSWPHILGTLHEKHGLRSVMVEGGATIIDSIFASHARAPLIDQLIVTVAPTIVGQDGLAYSAPGWLNSAGLTLSNSKRLAGEAHDVGSGEATGVPSGSSVALAPVADACPRTFGVDKVYALSYI